ncbi:dTDP-4-dehydrorhamnose reductase [Parachitinimonas caeni]|uniref:dTDP-4-dehydrorhamnose reductase n=1 Tax=Parachitinimonas caeni TaxID=3031301 RepID=A0ABT7E1C4_9NEIS|nr:dTDP-4-dehydrorhamnose reductase [Parachitinimonas caeni]MDK2126126.1 dTDP-4-dehydrorhamnose reductase [Parachitinimonas caeni]
MTNMKTILVTGVNGQVGWELQRSLQGLGRIVALSRNEMDLSNPDSIRTAVRQHNPGLIINPAAYTAVDQAEKEVELAHAINGIAPGVLAEEAKRLNAPLIHFSTDYVYDGDKAGRWLETDATNPQSAYGRSKLAGEEAIRAVQAQHLILRTSWVYAARGKNFLLTMLRLAKDKDTLGIVADQFGAPTWCRTLADMTAHIVASRPDWHEVSGTYHFTCSGETSWHGFATAIFAESAKRGNKVPATLNTLTTDQYPLPAKRPKNSRLSLDKLDQTFGITPPSWEQALALCFEDIR